MGNVTYTFDESQLSAFVGYIRDWGTYEADNSRMARIGDSELAELVISCMRYWDGPGHYRILGPCDLEKDENFDDFNQMVDYMSNWSRTMRAEKIVV